MTANSNNNNQTSSPLFVGIVGFFVFAGLVGACNDTVAPPTPTTTSAPNTFEYRYAKERFRQEGFSGQDADTAARAVLKFQEAQRARQQ